MNDKDKADKASEQEPKKKQKRNRRLREKVRPILPYGHNITAGNPTRARRSAWDSGDRD